VNAAVEITADGGYRNFSTRDESVRHSFAPQTGLSLTFADRSLVAPELKYALTKAEMGTIKILEHTGRMGIRVSPRSRDDFFLAVSLGINLFLTQYRGGKIATDNSVGPYVGGHLVARLGVLVFRLDFTQAFHHFIVDSSSSIMLGAGISI